MLIICHKYVTPCLSRSKAFAGQYLDISWGWWQYTWEGGSWLAFDQCFDLPFDLWAIAIEDFILYMVGFVTSTGDIEFFYFSTIIM